MSTSMPLSWEQSLAWRVGQQFLSTSSQDLQATASRVIGLHAQVASSAELIAAVRTPSVRPGDVDIALWADHTLVKTWGMRGTLHLFPAVDLPLLVSAFGQRRWPKFTPAWERYHGVSPDQLRAITAAVGEVLPGRFLTREELTDEIAAAVGGPGIATAVRSGWGQMLKPAAAGGLLCYGPDRERNVTFTDPRTWVPDAGWNDAPDEHTALATVITRFLDVFGPATPTDFGRWWGTDPASAKKLFRAHAEVMVPVDVAGTAAWMTPAGAESASAVPAADAADALGGVRLLPGFDPYVTAPHSHRAHTIPDGEVAKVSRTAGWISPTLLIDGRIRGVWTHQLSAGWLVVDVAPFAPVGPEVRRKVEGAVDRYAEYLGADVEIRWTAEA